MQALSFPAVPPWRRMSCELFSFFQDFASVFDVCDAMQAEMQSVMQKQENTRVLISRARSGDREAFDQLTNQYGPRLMGFIRARLGTQLRQQVEVDDIFQDAVLRAFQSMDRFQWRGDGSLFSWLATVVEYVIRDVTRRNRRRPQVSLENDPVADGVSPSKVMRRNERFDRLEHALQQLTKDHRDVIQLSRVKKLSVEEIARRMNRSPGAIRHLLLRALEKLRVSFGEETESFHLPDRSLEEGGEIRGE